MGNAKIQPERNTLLLPYQAKWVKDRARLKLAEKSRQIGWTWASAYELVSQTCLAEARNEEWISSRDDIQARLFLQDCKAFAALLDLGARDLGERAIDEKGHTAYQLAMANGLLIHSMSSNPDAQAGKRGGRTLDEFALHPDPRKLYSIAYPGITWGGQLRIFSTHRGSANFFNQLVLECREKKNPKGISLHRVTLEDALNQGFLAKLQAKLPPEDERQAMDEAAYFDFTKAGCADEESFLEEYMCVPSDDASAFLGYDLIDAAKYKPGTAWEKTLGELSQCGALFLGVDVGRKHDLTVLWVLEKSGSRCETRKLIELQATPFAEQERRLYELLALPNLRRCCIDATGIGLQFTERAQQAYGEYHVEAVTFTGPVKAELAYPVRSILEDRNLGLPDDRKVVSDLRGIRKETTAAGNIRFTGERSESGHCDRFWALALALHASKDEGGALTSVQGIHTGGTAGSRPLFLPRRYRA